MLGGRDEDQHAKPVAGAMQSLFDKLQSCHQGGPVQAHPFGDQPHLDGGPVKQEAQQQPDRPLYQQDLVPAEPEAELEHQQRGEHGQQGRPEGGNVAISIAGRGQHGHQFGVRVLFCLSDPGLKRVIKLFGNHLVVS